VISGGRENSMGSGVLFSTIPGGRSNRVAADYAFAAGRRAKVNHDGTFAWADSTDSDFVSSGTNQFLIRASGGVGIGTTNPVADFHVNGNSLFQGTSLVPAATMSSNLLNLAVGIVSNGFQNGITFYENSITKMSLGYDGTGSGDNNALRIYDNAAVAQFSFELGGNLGLGVNNPSNAIDHVSGAKLTLAGVWSNASDVNRKTDFSAVDARAVLAKLTEMPVRSWRYTNESATIRHIGPTAQDFKSTFGLGIDDKSIGTVDADGVALAAIQGLNEKVESGKQKAEIRIQKLEAENAELRNRLEKLEKLIQSHGL
jgi:hypothetical protein